MIIYCSKCKLNWARLKIVDGDGDETSDVCPECETDMFLEDGNDTECYIKQEVTGKIINIRTRREMRPETPKPPPLRAVKDYNREAYMQREDLETLAIDNYHAARDRGEDGREAFFNTFQKAQYGT